MQSTNLFGVMLQGEQDTLFEKQPYKYKSSVAKALKELVEMAQLLDPEGESRDFTKAKKFMFVDPYNPEHNSRSDFTRLRFEDKKFLRASLVLDTVRDELQ